MFSLRYLKSRDNLSSSDVTLSSRMSMKRLGTNRLSFSRRFRILDFEFADSGYDPDSSG